MKNSVLLVLALGVGLPVYGADQKLTKEQIDETFEKTIKEKFDYLKDPKYQEISKKIAQEYRQINHKKDLPLSNPLIKEMVAAAKKHDKEKLRTLLANYFALLYGNDWPKFLEKPTDAHMERKLFEEVEYGDMVIGTVVGLSLLYFNTTHNTTQYESSLKKAEELIKALGFDDPSYRFMPTKQLTTKEALMQAYKKGFAEWHELAKPIHDKFEKAIEPIRQARRNDIAKKYGLSKRMASLSLDLIENIPFSIPLVKEMMVAADEHNKEKLKDSLSRFLTIYLGSDWRSLLKEIHSDDLTARGSNQAYIISALGDLYFTKGLVEQDMVLASFSNARKLLTELFDIRFDQ